MRFSGTMLTVENFSLLHSNCIRVGWGEACHLPFSLGLPDCLPWWTAPSPATVYGPIKQNGGGTKISVSSALISLLVSELAHTVLFYEFPKSQKYRKSLVACNIDFELSAPIMLPGIASLGLATLLHHHTCSLHIA